MAIVTKGRGGALKASEISNVPAGDIAATDVQAAINELDTEKITNATHTGEVTGSGALTITAKAVTYAKIQDVSATDKLLGRSSAGAGDIEEITLTAAGRALLDDADADAQRATLSAAKLGANEDITSITRATGGPLALTTGSAVGDDLVVNTDQLVVAGATGRVGIGTTSSNRNLTVLSTAGAVATFESTQTDAIGAGISLGSAGTTSNYVRMRAHGNAMGLFTGGVRRVLIDENGNVGIGTSSPGNPLAVNRSADGVIVDFESADTVEGTISILNNTTSYNAFVGSHYTQLKTGQEAPPIGAVVVSTGEIILCEVAIERSEETKTETPFENAFEIVDVEINLLEEIEVGGKIKKVPKRVGEEFHEYRLIKGRIEKTMRPVYAKTIAQETRLKPGHVLDPETGKIFKTITTKTMIAPDVKNKEYFPYVDMTSIPGDKRVYGVWLGKMSDDSMGAAFGQNDKPVYLIAQVGLFKIRVTDTNGGIEVGDYLEASSRPMEAQKQIGIEKKVGTIAKAMIAVDWADIDAGIELGYKWKLIPCIF